MQGSEKGSDGLMEGEYNYVGFIMLGSSSY
jgi:hypothetical protein